MNIPLIEALLQMLGYSKFKKELMQKKRVVNVKSIEVLQSCIVVMSSSLTTIKEDLGAFTIQCSIGVYKFDKSFCDLWATINLMSLIIFKKLGLRNPKPTPMRLSMMDCSIKKWIGILFDVLVKVDDFISPVDFMVLHYEVDVEVPLILVRPSLLQEEH